MEIRDNRAKEWFWLDNQYLNGYAKYLGVYCTAVYLSLCRHSDNKTQKCFPSMNLIAEENGMSIKTVERATKSLEEWGIVNVQRSKKEDGTQANNVYTLTAKSMWKSKPTDSQSIGSRQTHSPKPTDSDDDNRQTVVLHNYTHINKTHIRGINPQSIKSNKKPMKKNSFKYNENQHTDTFESVIDIDTGESQQTKEPKRQKAINAIKEYFADKCEEKMKIRPIMGKKENIIVANLYNKGLKPSDLYEVIDWWFDTEVDKLKLIHLSYCLSNNALNTYRAFKA